MSENTRLRAAADAIIAAWDKDTEGSVNGHVRIHVKLLRELREALQETEVKPEPPSMIGAGPAYGGPPPFHGARNYGSAWVPDQTEFDVVLTDYPAEKRTAIIRVLRSELNIPSWRRWASCLCSRAPSQRM